MFKVEFEAVYRPVMALLQVRTRRIVYCGAIECIFDLHPCVLGAKTPLMLTITDLTVRIAGRMLIENANVSIPSGAKAGLVGRNGSGKTTLFNVISGDHGSETGSITIPRGLRLGRVAQEAPGTEQSLLEIVLAADTERLELLKEAETATDPLRISDIQIRLNDIDAHSAESRAAEILAGLRFDNEAQARPASSFSGGWRMRVALAAVLFSKPDVLLLDEPTNYLDLEGTLWLEAFVARYTGTVLIISHDRDLLNNAVNSIVHLEDMKLTFYRGSYDNFERQRAEQQILQSKARVKQEARMAHMQAFVDRFRAKASKAKQAQSRLKALEKMQPISALRKEHVAPINFPNPVKIASSPIIKLEGVNCGYEAGKPILQNLNLNIDADDRIALLGANGNGKSTFAKLLSNQLPQVNGEIVKADKLKIAVFAQHQMDDLRENETPVEHVRALMPRESEARVRSRVAQMGLDINRMDTVAKNLSGGEKARLLLGLIVFEGPNLLILDEPTNHLDMDTREALVHALNSYTGAVVLISHDRHLIDASVDRLWIVGEGQVRPYEDDMDAYRTLILKGAKASNSSKSEKPPKQSQAERRKKAAEQRKTFAPLRKEILQIEKEMQGLQEKMDKIDVKLATPGLFENQPDDAEKLSKMRSATENALAEKEALWMKRSEVYESETRGV